MRSARPTSSTIHNRRTRARGQHKHGDKEPGTGFYDMARSLGYRFDEPYVFWTQQVQDVFRLHGRPQRTRRSPRRRDLQRHREPPVESHAQNFGALGMSPSSLGQADAFLDSIRLGRRVPRAVHVAQVA